MSLTSPSMSLTRSLTKIFLIIIWINSSLTSPSEITFTNGGYGNVVVGISSQVKEDQALLSRIEEFMTLSSSFLYKAMRQTAYFKEVKIVVPPTWNTTQNLADLSYHDAHIRVNIAKDDKSSIPYTKHTKGCGQSGDFIYFPVSFLYELYGKTRLNYGDPEKVLVHEWAHFRYGVFDERGDPSDPRFPLFYRNEEGEVIPNVCSVHQHTMRGELKDIHNGGPCQIDVETGLPEVNCSFLPDDDMDIRTSIMSYSFLPTVDSFCDASPERRHDSRAPTPQNLYCGNRSTWDVISRHRDFQGNSSGTLPRTAGFQTPTFTIMKAKRIVSIEDHVDERTLLKVLPRNPELFYNGTSHRKKLSEIIAERRRQRQQALYSTSTPTHIDVSVTKAMVEKLEPTVTENEQIPEVITEKSIASQTWLNQPSSIETTDPRYSTSTPAPIDVSVTKAVVEKLEPTITENEQIPKVIREKSIASQTLLSHLSSTETTDLQYSPSIPTPIDVSVTKAVVEKLEPTITENEQIPKVVKEISTANKILLSQPSSIEITDTSTASTYVTEGTTGEKNRVTSTQNGQTSRPTDMDETSSDLIIEHEQSTAGSKSVDSLKKIIQKSYTTYVPPETYSTADANFTHFDKNIPVFQDDAVTASIINDDGYDEEYSTQINLSETAQHGPRNHTSLDQIEQDEPTNFGIFYSTEEMLSEVATTSYGHSHTDTTKDESTSVTETLDVNRPTVTTWHDAAEYANATEMLEIPSTVLVETTSIHVPGVVTDLKAKTSSCWISQDEERSFQITLSWTSTEGKGRSYDVKVSDDPKILQEQFDTNPFLITVKDKDILEGSLKPVSSSGPQNLVLSSSALKLITDTDYYFALKVVDFDGNVGELSNLALVKGHCRDGGIFDDVLVKFRLMIIVVLVVVMSLGILCAILMCYLYRRKVKRSKRDEYEVMQLQKFL